MTIKIVVNAYSARNGGGQTYLKNLFNYVPNHVDLEILVFAPDNLKLQNHPRLKRVANRWPTGNPIARAFWERFIFPRYLRHVRADILFCPGGVVGTKVSADCKVVTMFRNMIPFDPIVINSMPWGLQRLRNLILNKVLLRSMANADLTIFISEYAREQIEKIVKIPNAVTIPHGISETFRTVNKKLPRPEQAPLGNYILYVSRFDIYKHHKEVVRAFTKLPEAMSKGLHLVFLGETDMIAAKPIYGMIDELGLKGRVHMLGAVPYEELPSWYTHAKLVLFASSCENCPNILLESMASGRPVISSNVMPMPEFGGEGLVYFSPYDSDDILRAMIDVLSCEEFAVKVGNAAKKQSERYNWSETAKETWDKVLAIAKGSNT